ncbi:motility protein A [Gottschalkia purinilytica]|uniref:Motility protein A n=1 Tax=Gottschalkia purinilytica TaxID=1503 RepID=A0A0L0WBG1_GOTPU|nr:motility protein A [Gottschalkia purinilytica]KNF08821.1 motility protein A [Gottschalkia purinilytica]
MDIVTLIGLVAGTGFVLFGILSSGSIMNFYDFASILIVLGGTIGSTLISYHGKKLKKALQITKIAFTTRKELPTKTIDDLINLSNIARREGLLALEEASQKIDDEFLKKGIMLIVDGTDPELVRNILETELTFLEERHSEGQGLFELLGTFAPAYGMVGTLIGLINMLKTLEDPSTVGPQMSVALVTTFYGSVLANLFFLPIANKLKVRSKEEILLKEIVVEGLLSIQAGENPRIIEEKLKTFLSPELRTGFKNVAGGEEA